VADGRQAWQRVLATVESDAARAAALLAGREDPGPGADHDPGADPGADHVHGADHDLAAVSGRAGGSAGAHGSGATEAGSTAPEGIPAVWRLPVQTVHGLPDLADMPPIPADLRDRIRSLRDRIDVLQADLVRALQLARTMRADRMPVRNAPPGYIDRRL
jgi:hypothetical protein